MHTDKRAGRDCVASGSLSPSGHGGEFFSTAQGMLAVALWGSMVACSRSLTESLGVLGAGAYVHLLAGAVACLLSYARRENRDALRQLPPRYLLLCGAFFMMNLACLYGAMGLACDRQQTVEVAIVNYLWPSLTLVFSVPILGKRAGVLLVPGMMLAFGGAVLAVTGGEGLSVKQLATHLRGNPAPYILALGCAVSWPFYSNLSRRWVGESKGDAVPLFLLATGIVLLAMQQMSPFEAEWSPRTGAELAYTALFPTCLAYSLWDRGVRKGNITLVAAFSYFTPLLSTVVSWVYLDVALPASLWGACLLVIAGAVLCNHSISDPAKPRD